MGLRAVLIRWMYVPLAEAVWCTRVSVVQANVAFLGGPMSELLFTAEELPQGFSYPRGLLRLVELELFELEPWWILTGDHLRALQKGMRDRYPTRHLVLFAKRQDNDDCVCFDMDTGKVSLVHDWASPGWEARGEFPDFNSWLHAAVDDLIEF